MPQQRRTGLRVRIAILVLILSVPPAFLLLHNALYERAEETAKVRRDALRLAQILAAEEEEMLNTTRQLLAAFALMPQFQTGDNREMHHFLAAILHQYKRYSDIGVVDRDGTILFSARQETPHRNIRDHDWFQQVLADSAFSIGTLQRSEADTSYILVFGYPVFNEANQIIRVVYAELNLSWLAQVENRLGPDFPEGSTFSKLSDDGEIILHYPEPAVWVGNTPLDTTLIMTVLHTQKGTVRRVGLDGIDRFYGYTAVNPGSPLESRIFVVLGIPADYSLGEIQHVLRTNIVFLALYVLLVSLSAWFLGVRPIVRPIRNLVLVAREFARGNLGARSHVPYSRYEPGLLAKTLDELGASLEATLQKLRESEETYRNLVEQLPAVTYRREPGVSGKVLFVSPQIEAVLGYTPDEWLASGTERFRAIHGDDRDTILRTFAAVVDPYSSYDAEFRALRKDGRTIWVANRERVVCDARGNPLYVQGILTDVTERRLADDALRESDRRYRELFNRNMAGVFRTRFDGTILDCNDAYATILGFASARDLIGQNARQAYLKEGDRDAFLAMLKRHGGVVTNYELGMRRKNGDRIWVLENVSLVDETVGGGTIIEGTMIDITERKLAMEAIQKQARRLEMLHQMDRAILHAQSSDEIARETVRQLRRILPFDRISVVGFDKTLSNAVILAAADKKRSTLVENVRIPIEDYVDIASSREGRERLVQDISSLEHPSETDNKLAREGILSYISIPMVAQSVLIGAVNLGSREKDSFDDERLTIAREVANQIAISLQQARLLEEIEMYAAELEGRVAQRTAELKERNDELETFTFSVSHDLRAPLRAIQGFSTILLDDFSATLPPTAREYLGRIQKATEYLDTLIADLLEYSRLGQKTLSPEPVALDRVVRHVLETFAQDMEQSGASVDVEEPLPEVLGHRATLQQVVQNLVGNALKYVEPGTSPEIRIRAEVHDGRVRLYVQDRGIGIPAEELDTIFKIFTRLHGIENYPGTGVGLAYVKKAVERLDGSVGVESTPGEGSTFWLELPAPEEE